MPEGHSVHRIANQFTRHFVGKRCEVSSPQGRFAEGAAQLDGKRMVASRAVGKQLFLEFEDDLFLRVHLGLYGAWDFAGVISTSEALSDDDDREESLASIGAPRLARYRMAEQEKSEDPIEAFPPDPVGQVRVRLLTEDTVGDLRGPTACVVEDAAGVQRALDKLGPDPVNDDGPEAEKVFVDNVRKRNVAIGQLLMDQAVVSGIGNIYRAELLFRQRLDPYKVGKKVTVKQAKALWADWSKLLHDGVRDGLMMTMDGLSDTDRKKALRSRKDRHWVYHRQGEPCRVCGTEIRMADMAGRKLYWCPKDQK
ncbi:DNA-formamidopyrimidine glycosylase family protein [Curtobacterium sp. MCLR17_007]|uniref:Fpg/Nei family DNA glycosylase n=1 Tax=unclassified Curtobacterium TaxID=257496 RepID=UPI0006F5A649|nr:MULTISPECIES: DNA-formamidopyrimidine glycosylase family protein [unclassified Curtobacterium]KQS08750.1 DNA glycosylase [Curtobacterium sp. Leaf183]WIB61251.1 DNA-formamidopyrimidine glycosylase family protein [Curtobacterium sp. MCLR17_007]